MLKHVNLDLRGHIAEYRTIAIYRMSHKEDRRPRFRFLNGNLHYFLIRLEV